MKFPHLAEGFCNTPVLIRPDNAGALVASLSSGLIGGRYEAEKDSSDRAAVGLSEGSGRTRIYDVVDGVAIIPVEGVLVNKWGLHPRRGATGYDGLTQKLLEAVDDSDVKAIAFLIDSPGGQVSGCKALCDLIYAASLRGGGDKPIFAIVDEHAYSAAYWIASSCDKIVVPETGGVGSIGVLVMHVDFEKALDDIGLAVTLIHAGSHKVDGNPYEKLPANVREDIQKSVEDTRLMFAGSVARNRGLGLKDVLDTEARTYPGSTQNGRTTAIDVGLADEIMTPLEAWNSIQKALGRA